MSFRNIVLCLAGAALLYFIFGGPIFGPYFDDCANRQSLRDFVHDCPRNETRLRFYSTEYKEFMEVRVNLDSRALAFSGGGLRYDTRGYFWVQRIRSVFHTVTFPLMSPLPPAVLSVEQLDQLKSALSAMPPAAESSPTLDWNHDESYLVFYRQDDLQVHCFAPGHVPSQFAAVCQTIGFGPFFDAWNAGRMP